MRAIPGAQACRRCDVPTPTDQLTVASKIPGAGKRGGYCPSCTAILKKLYVVRGH